MTSLVPPKPVPVPPKPVPVAENGDARKPSDLRFTTVLPDGTELSLDDPKACREIALRVELLSRGLSGRGDRPEGEAFHG